MKANLPIPFGRPFYYLVQVNTKYIECPNCIKNPGHVLEYDRYDDSRFNVQCGKCGGSAKILDEKNPNLVWQVQKDIVVKYIITEKDLFIAGTKKNYASYSMMAMNQTYKYDPDEIFNNESKAITEKYRKNNPIKEEKAKFKFLEN